MALLMQKACQTEAPYIHMQKQRLGLSALWSFGMSVLKWQALRWTFCPYFGRLTGLHSLVTQFDLTACTSIMIARTPVNDDAPDATLRITGC